MIEKQSKVHNHCSFDLLGSIGGGYSRRLNRKPNRCRNRYSLNTVNNFAKRVISSALFDFRLLELFAEVVAQPPRASTHRTVLLPCVCMHALRQLVSGLTCAILVPYSHVAKYQTSADQFIKYAARWRTTFRCTSAMPFAVPIKLINWLKNTIYSVTLAIRYVDSGESFT